MPRISMQKTIEGAKRLKSEDGDNREYDRALLELVNELLERPLEGRFSAEARPGYSTALPTFELLGFTEAYARSLYEKSTTIPTGGEAVKSQAGPKLHHAVMPHGSVTFTDYDEALEFLGPKTVENVNGDEPSIFLCESDVTPEEYDRVSKWRGATS